MAAVLEDGQHVALDPHAVHFDGGGALAAAGGVVEVDVVLGSPEGAQEARLGDVGGQARVYQQAVVAAAGAEDPLDQQHSEPGRRAGAPRVTAAAVGILDG